VVPVHDLGPDEQSPYFAMKRLTGTTLHDVITGDDPAWTRRKLLARFVEVCLAVEFAHKHGVIHRDLKPANIMLGDFGETYVLDWGLARIVGDSQDTLPLGPIGAIHTGDLRSDSGSGGQTQAGALLGTPGYMPPEQMRGEPVDFRADVFALGCILFEILAGTPAIPRDKVFEVTLGTPDYHPAQRRPELDIPPELDALCARATASERERRPSSARELADEVQRFLDGDRDLERRKQLAAEHATRAGVAYSRTGESARAEAMREAGRAIALDPHNVDAQGLLMRLMLEIPQPIPEGARRHVQADHDAATRTVIKVGARAYFANLMLLPLAKLLGVGGSWPFLATGAILVAQVVILLLAGRRERPFTPVIWAVMVGLHVALLTVTGIAFGTMLFLPLFALGSLPLMLMLPAINRPLTALLAHLTAIALPLALELARVIPSSFEVKGDALVIRPWAVTFDPRVLPILYFTVATLQMVVTSRVLGSQRDKQDRAHEQIHAQRWQLEQMVQSE
jgi:serine/threonine-protein kinase